MPEFVSHNLLGGRNCRGGAAKLNVKMLQESAGGAGEKGRWWLSRCACLLAGRWTVLDSGAKSTTVCLFYWNGLFREYHQILSICCSHKNISVKVCFCFCLLVWYVCFCCTFCFCLFLFVCLFLFGLLVLYLCFCCTFCLIIFEMIETIKLRQLNCGIRSGQQRCLFCF